MVATRRLAQERARNRRKQGRHGTLVERCVSKRTLINYRGAVSKFLGHCMPVNGNFPKSAAEVDLQLCQYIEQVWQEGDPKGWAMSALSGIIHFIPSLGPCLFGSRRLLKAWGKSELCNRAPPLPARFALALAGAALELKDLRLALLVLVAFHGLLRTGEAVSLRARQFVYPDPAGPCLLTLGQTKSGQRRSVASSESVVLTDPTLLAYVRVVIPRLQPGERLFSKSEPAFRDDFRTLVSAAQLPAAGWRPYSLRRGGATSHFLEYGSLDRTAVRGRWQSTRTARIYIDEGVATLAGLTTTPIQNRRIQSLAGRVTQPLGNVR